MAPCFCLFAFILSSLLHFTVAHFASRHPLCLVDERSALLQFKDSLSINKLASDGPGDYPKVASWNPEEENSECCSWDGVTCNVTTGHVIGLDLSSSWLDGSIDSSSSLFHLVHLKWLNLADNNFNESPIPSGFINLSRLLHLDLSAAAFSGQIPAEILELSKLVYLDLSFNINLELRRPNLKNLAEKLINLKVLYLTRVKVSSFIPHVLANLSSLTHLSLNHCDLQGELDGSILSSFGNLTKLVSLGLSYNNFKGTIPPSVGYLTRLVYLDLSFNNFLVQNSSSLSWLTNISKLNVLDLSSINLVGEIPFELMNLKQLKELYIAHNQLPGPIPSWLMNMNQLTALSLSDNQLTGPIPSEIKNLTQLENLDLSLNQLQGSIPISIFELKNLQILDFSSNNLSGTVELDRFLLNFKSLIFLILSSNNLSLLAKASVDIQQQFESIGFGSCKLSEFPSFLGSQHRLLSLDLSSNNIQDQVPGWFLNVSIDRLSSLNLSHNLLTGFDHQHYVVLPWIRLASLDLRFNKLQGSLPVPPVSTIFYLVSNNRLTEEIPSRICSLKGLRALDLSNNNLSGMLPQCLGNFSHDLSVLQLQSNKFRGTIPQTFVKGTNLKMIDLSGNLLGGRVPKSLVNCMSLEFLNLGDNHIIDTFPSWLGTLPELKVLILRSNRFHGALKELPSDFGFPKLRIIDLSHNRFTGKLPSKYFEGWNALKIVNGSRLTYMQIELRPSQYVPGSFFNFDQYAFPMTIINKGMQIKYGKISSILTGIILSSNRFEGEIPTSIGNLKGLHCLDLSNNSLQGYIPPSLGSLASLESLDLSNNMLSGDIPQDLTQLTFLSFFNVSNNHLSGHVPQGKQFDTFENDSFIGNPGLCGKPLSRRCKNLDAIEKEGLGSKSQFKLDRKMFLSGCASGLVIGVVLGQRFTTTKQIRDVWEVFRKQLKCRTQKKRGNNNF